MDFWLNMFQISGRWLLCCWWRANISETSVYFYQATWHRGLEIISCPATTNRLLIITLRNTFVCISERYSVTERKRIHTSQVLQTKYITRPIYKPKGKLNNCRSLWFIVFTEYGSGNSIKGSLYETHMREQVTQKTEVEHKMSCGCVI
jgi:hypothetical protein